MKVSRTGITQCSKLIKRLSGSGVSVTSRLGALSAQPVLPRLTCFKSRTHNLLDGIKEKGLKGELVDFMWVEFTPSLDLVDLATDPSMEVTWMKCKTYSSSTFDVRSAMILCNDIT